MPDVVLERDLDSRRRLSLSGIGDASRYRMTERHDGSILLRPVVSVLARDLIYDENADRSRISLERAFLDASVAVWREIDAATERGKYQGIEVTEEGRQLRLAERVAWLQYKAVLDAAES